MGRACVLRSVDEAVSSAGSVADRLDVVAVGIADEGAVVARVVLRPDARLMQDLRAGADGRGEEGVDELAVGCRESDVRLAETVAGRLPADPERGRSTPYPMTGPNSMIRSAAERRQNSVVEGRALDEISALNRQVIKHGGSLPDGTDSSEGIETAA